MWRLPCLKALRRWRARPLALLAGSADVDGWTWFAGAATDWRPPMPAALYRQHCAACHGEQRTGGMGPALLPESLERLRRPRR
jgi:mono/diheme cytochrome c family protein